MRQVFGVLTILLVSHVPVLAQSAQSSSTSVPRLINVTGVFRPADGQAPAAVESVTLSIYADQEGGTALWQETQSVTLDDRGRYSLLLGATTPGGIPSELFGSTEAHWLATRFERSGEVEGPRVRLTSVPYALRAANADTLGGRAASDYVVVPAAKGNPEGTQSDTAAPAAELPGTPNFLAKYVSATDVGPSTLLYDNGANVGIGTTTPFDVLHVRFNNPGGNLTGLAVQNMGSSATSYSGMLFFDQNNQLGQFQGFNNSTHEYRINNIARTGAGGGFDGSINFMTGSTSRFFIGTNGGIGIGTALPLGALEVSNVLTGFPSVHIVATTYADNTFPSVIYARKARGTAATPSSVHGGDNLVFFGAKGFGVTAFGNGFPGIGVRATQNWTDVAQGASMSFDTTANDSNTSATRMTITSEGNVGIGTATPGGNLDVSSGQINVPATTVTSTYANSTLGAFILGRKTRGTAAAPSAVGNGDTLASFSGRGFATSNFGIGGGGMSVSAAENWTDATQGTLMYFNTTANGTTASVPRMAITAAGDVGIGTPLDGTGFPTAADKLQVFGDVRVGTTGTNGCLKNFAGTGIPGTCASDRRCKKDVTPFSPVLDRLAALQPVYYYWRS